MSDYGPDLGELSTSRSVWKRYWRRLTRSAPPRTSDEPTETPEADDVASDTIAAERTERLEAAVHYVSPAAEQEVAHALEPFSRFIERNPPKTRWLVNALRLTRAVAILQARRCAP